MKIKSTLILTICLMTISQTFVYSMARYASKVSVPVRNVTQPLNQPIEVMPEATLNPELLNQAQQDFQLQQVQQPARTSQKMMSLAPELKKISRQPLPKPIPVKKQRFWSSGVGPFKSTAPKLMSKSEALKTLNLDQSASPEGIKMAHKKAALKAHPDAGGSNEEMQKVNEARDVLTGKQNSSLQDVDSDENQSYTNDQNAEPKMDSLFEAVQNNDLKIIENLVRAGKNVNIQNSYGNTPLHEALRKKNIIMIKVLLDLGADPNMQNAVGRSPLFEAVDGKFSVDILKILLGAGGNPNILSNLYGTTPLHQAVFLGHNNMAKALEMVQALMDAGADPNIVDKIIGEKVHLTALQHAQKRGYLKIVEILTPKKKVFNAQNPSKIKTSLFQAVRNNDIDAIKSLIDQGEDLDGYDDFGATPLLQALYFDRKNGVDEMKIDAVRALLQAGANVNLSHKNNKSHMPLLMAARNYVNKPQEVAEVINMLLKAGANPNEQDYMSGHTALSSVVDHKNIRAIRSLIDAGANPSLVTRHKFSNDITETPLEEFIRKNSSDAKDFNLNNEIVKILLNSGTYEQSVKDRAIEFLERPFPFTSPF